MKASLLSLVTALAVASIAQAIPAPAPGALIGQPRYYFPRMIKREVIPRQVNITLSEPTSRSVPSRLQRPTPTADVNSPSGSPSAPPDAVNAPSGTPTQSVGNSLPTASSEGNALSSLLDVATSALGSSSTDANPGTTAAATGSSNTADPTGSPSTTGSVLVGLSSVISDLTDTATKNVGTPTVTPSQDPATETSKPTAGTSDIVSSVPSQITTGASDVFTTPSFTTPVFTTPGFTTPVFTTPIITPDPTNTGTGAPITTTPNNPVTTPPIDTTKEPITTPSGDGTTNPPFTTPITTPPSDGSTTNKPITTPPSDGTTTNNPVTTPPSDGTTTNNPITTSGITGPGTGTTSNPPPAQTTTGPSSDPVNSATNTGTGLTSVSSEPSAAPTSSAGSSIPATSAPVSIVPTGTNSQTALALETSIQSATNSPTEAPQSTASVLPSTLPRIIQPSGGVPNAPDNSTLVQLGFTYGLNYPFVVGSTTAVAQIFAYLPAGVSHGVDLTNEKVLMSYLQPYNTLPTLGYITTLAMAYIPTKDVSALSLALLNPNSALYNNPNPSIKTLMAMVDPSIPLLAGATAAGGSPISSSNSASTASNNPDAGSAAGDNNSSSSGIRPSSVGIGVGVVAGAAVYGAAMFFVARRYKKKKARHNRSSSVYTGSSGSGSSISRANEGSDLINHNRDSYGTRLTSAHSNQPMGGRVSRNSDRSRETGRNYISPPVMAENSLGWN